MAHLQLSCLGPPRVWLDDQPLVFPTRKALALLVYLAVEGGLQPRPKLMALFWPASDSDRSRSALRSTLAYLRRAFERVSPDSSHQFLRIEADTIGFNFDTDYELDIQIVEKVEAAPDLAASELWQKVDDLYQGEFLDGFSLPNTPEFDDWLSLQRERWHQAISHVFDHLSQAHMNIRRFEAAIAIAGRWVHHDPLHEPAHRRLMEIYALAGNKSEALQAFRTCQTALQSTLNIDPSPTTQALAERIKRSQLSGDGLSPAETALNPKPDLPFVGRSTEYAELTRRYQQARGGQTQLVVVKGEAGIGKSRLAEEFLKGLVLQGADVLRGRAFETGGRLPYQPLVDIFRRRLEHENAPDDLLADVWLVELSRLLPELRERYPDLPPPTPDETLGRIRLSEAVTRLGKALARQHPVALYLDDLQWADAASLDMLHYACRHWSSEQAPILLLFALRTEALVTSPEVGDWLSMLGRDLLLTELPLQSLSTQETEALVAQLGQEQESTSFPATFAEWLYKETGGQPFFINETIRALSDQDRSIGVLPSESTLPPGVRKVILARLGHVSPEAAALLTASAVLGRPCSFERLCQITGIPEIEALSALEMSLNHHLLQETGDARRPYTFTHDKIRDVVYTEAGDARRRIYHRRAFEALEQAQASPGELAHHALRAPLTEEAFRYSIAAGDDAMKIFAVRDAIGFYEQARALIPDLQALISNLQPLISNLYSQLARAYEVIEAPHNTELICQEMLTLAQKAGWLTLECAALNRLASLAIYAQQMDRAMALLTQAKQVAETGDDKAGLVQTEWSLGQLTHHIDDFKASQAHSERALALAREIGDQALIAGTTQTLAFALLFQGQIAAGQTAMAEAREGYVALGNRALEADALVGLTMPYLLNGETGKGVESARSAHAIGQEIENEFSQCMSRSWLVCGLVDQGDYEEALAIAPHNLAMARSQALAPKILAAFSAGLLYWALGDYSTARKVHLELMPHLEEAGVPSYLEQNLAHLCVDSALAGDWESAHTYARQALSYHDYRTLPLLLKPHWPETETLLRGGDTELARQDVHRWGDLAGEIPRFRVGYLRSLALLAEWDGDIGRAISSMEEALSLAEEITLPGEQWPILAKLGQLQQINGDERQAQRASIQALEIIQALAAKINDESLRVRFVKGCDGPLV